MKRRLAGALVALISAGGLFAGAAVAGGSATAAETPAVEFGRVQLATGPTLHYAVQGPADGPVFIMVHGLSDSWYSFAPVLPLLPGSWRVYSITQRGHGDSEKPVGDYSPPSLARDVVAFMDAIGAERATLVGHSLGGIVAQHALALAPHRFERVVLIGTIGAARRMPGMDEFRAAIHGLSDPVPVDFAREFQLSTIFVEQREAFVDSVVAESAKLPAHVWQALVDGMLETDAAPGLEAVDLPALVLWGNRDTYMSLEEQRALVERLRARFIVYPGIGHAVHWEAPDEVARDLVEFVARS